MMEYILLVQTLFFGKRSKKFHTFQKMKICFLYARNAISLYVIALIGFFNKLLRVEEEKRWEEKEERKTDGLLKHNSFKLNLFI